MTWICEKCGAEAVPGGMFCSKCGTKLSQPTNSNCEKCGTLLPQDAFFCPKCGHNVASIKNISKPSNHETTIATSQPKENASNSLSDEDKDRQELIESLQNLNEAEFNLAFKKALYGTNVANEELCNLYDSFFGQNMFEKIDYAEIIRKICDIRNEVTLLTVVTKFLEEQYECSNFLEQLFDVLKKYLNLFVARTKLFEDFLEKLHSKSQGYSYSILEYNADFDKLKELETHSINLGTSLQSLTTEYMKLTEK